MAAPVETIKLRDGTDTGRTLVEHLELHKRWLASDGAAGQRLDLSGADLRRCDLRGADLAGAELGAALLKGAAYDARTRWPDGFDGAAAGAVLKAPAPPPAALAAVSEEDILDGYDWSVRTANALSILGVRSLEQLAQYTERELLATRNLGRRSLHEIEAALATRGLTLRAP